MQFRYARRPSLPLICHVLMEQEEYLLEINEFTYASNVRAQFLFPFLWNHVNIGVGTLKIMHSLKSCYYGD